MLLQVIVYLYFNYKNTHQLFMPAMAHSKPSGSTGLYSTLEESCLLGVSHSVYNVASELFHNAPRLQTSV